MWNEIAKKDKFLVSLYNDIPSLNNVLIYDIIISKLYDDINLRFSLSTYADNPPEKWINYEFNTVMLELKCCVIKDMEIKSNSGVGMCNINITKEYIEIIGDITAKFSAEDCMISRVTGYCDGRLV